MNFNLEIKNFLKIFEKEKYNRQNLRMLCQDFFDNVALKMGLKSEFKIELVDGDRFGRIASVNIKESKILINALRAELLEKYKIQSDEIGFEKWIDDFKQGYENGELKDNFNESIYQTIVDQNWQDYIFKLGNFKYIPYEWIDAIFHETEHIKQDEIAKKINEDKFEIKTEDDAFCYFVYAFDKTYHFLRKRNLLGNFVRKNEYFPSEICSSLKTIEIFIKYVEENDDDIAKKYLKFRDLISVSKEEFVLKVVSDFENLIKIALKYDEEFEKENKIYQENKNKIKSKLEKFYDKFKA